MVGEGVGGVWHFLGFFFSLSLTWRSGGVFCFGLVGLVGWLVGFGYWIVVDG